MLCSPDTTFARGFAGASRCSGTLSSTRLSLELFKPFWQIMRRVSSYFLVVTLSNLVDAGCSVGVTVSFDADVGEECEDELKELVDRPRTTNGTLFAVLQSIFLPLLMRCVF